MNELNLKNIMKLKGNEAKKRFIKLSNHLMKTNVPLYLVGPSGSGKTIMAKNLAKLYATKLKVQAYYVQLSPDQTKTSIILGLRLVNGSMIPSNGVVAEAMKKGGIVIVDETSHASQDLLLMFNGICDRDSITSIGDKTIEADKNFRIIFCSNDSTYAGNNKLPQSFAQRVIAYNFDYPSAEEECKIARYMVKEDIGGCNAPDSVFMYLTSIMRNSRKSTYPLSVRNVANAVLSMELCVESRNENLETTVDKITKDNSAEAILQNIFKLIHNREATNVGNILGNKLVNDLLEYIHLVSIEDFREAVLSSFMIYMDVDGFSDTKKIKEQIVSTLLGGKL